MQARHDGLPAELPRAENISPIPRAGHLGSDLFRLEVRGAYKRNVRAAHATLAMCLCRQRLRTPRSLAEEVVVAAVRLRSFSPFCDPDFPFLAAQLRRAAQIGFKRAVSHLQRVW